MLKKEKLVTRVGGVGRELKEKKKGIRHK